MKPDAQAKVLNGNKVEQAKQFIASPRGKKIGVIALAAELAAATMLVLRARRAR